LSFPLYPDNVHDPCQIIGQNRQSHLGGYFWKRFGEEVRRSHTGLHRAERMFDCLSTLAHGFWVCIKAPLHSLEQMLMLPSRNSPLGVAIRTYHLSSSQSSNGGRSQRSSNHPSQ
jgi:hypothetical protein